MESEHYDIFQVELATKIVVLGSWGTYFMHMRVKECLQGFTKSSQSRIYII